MEKGRVFSVNFSQVKGIAKKAQKRVRLIEGFGVEGDAHAGLGIRQVSLLAIESIRKQGECAKALKTGEALEAGDFAENITTEGVVLADLKIGDRLFVGTAVLEVSKIGKECHKHCAIYHKLGDCIMPKEGIFAKVLKGADISVGDSIEIVLTGIGR